MRYIRVKIEMAVRMIGAMMCSHSSNMEMYEFDCIHISLVHLFDTGISAIPHVWISLARQLYLANT